MTTTEKLQRIRAKCVELLEIASERTPGKWWIDEDGNIMEQNPFSIHAADVDVSISPEDAAFIASCAGAAEAGWKSTIAAIDFLLRKKPSPTASFGFTRSEINAINAIISEWPDELFTNAEIPSA